MNLNQVISEKKEEKKKTEIEEINAEKLGQLNGNGKSFGVGCKGNLLFENLVWMTSGEAAQYLRKSVGALRTAVCREQIQVRKWRRRLYFRRQDLDRLLDSSEWKRGI